jgi:phosphinothricin acetyltransferase
MNPFVKIRLIRPEDHAGVLAIYAPFVSGSAITFEYEVPSAEDFSGRIRKVTAFYPWLVAEANGTIAGYAYASPHRERAAYQWSVESSVYIDGRFQRRGTATALYQTLFRLLRLQGFVNVFAGLTLPNDKSHHFHAAIGFEPVGVYSQTGYKLGRWHDVLWMSLALQPHGVDPAPPRPWTAIDDPLIRTLLLPSA